MTVSLIALRKALRGAMGAAMTVPQALPIRTPRAGDSLHAHPGMSRRLGKNVFSDSVDTTLRSVLTGVDFRLDAVPDEQRYAVSALLVEHDLKCLCDLVLAGVAQASGQDDETLLRPWG